MRVTVSSFAGGSSGSRWIPALSNPSTISITDGTEFSSGERPTGVVRVETPWPPGARVEVLRLNGPGTNAKSQVNVSGITFDSKTGAKVGSRVSETLKVGRRGVVAFELDQAQGVLLELADSGK